MPRLPTPFAVLAIIAAGLAVAAIPNHASSHQEEGHHGSAERQQHASDLAGPPDPLSALGRAGGRQFDHNPDIGQPRSPGHAEEVNEHHDPVVLPTWILAWTAIFQTVLILVGTIVLFRTLYQTRQANLAAREAVAVTRDVGEAQLRAYLTVGKPRAIVENGILTVRLDATNRGQTPAMNLDPSFGIGFAKADTLPDVELSRTEIEGSLAPGDEVGLLGYGDFTPYGDWMDAINTSAEVLHVRGRIRYADVFGKRWERRFAFYLVDINDLQSDRPRWHTSRLGNDFRPAG